MAGKKPTKTKKRTHTNPFSILVAIDEKGNIYSTGAIEHRDGKPPRDEDLRNEISNLLYDFDGDKDEPIAIKRFDYEAIELPKPSPLPKAEKARVFSWNREVVFVDRTTDEGQKLIAKQAKSFREDRKAEKANTKAPTKKR